METDILLICSLTGCQENQARDAFLKHNKDALLAIDSILFPNQSLPVVKKRKREDITDNEEYIDGLRKTMREFDAQTDARSISNQPECVELIEKQTPLEETARQNNCLQECQIPSMEVEDQIQGTVCR